MDFAVLTAMLVWVAAALGSPVPPMPTIYPAVPEQQICAMVTGKPCAPEIRLRADTGVWLGVASRRGNYIAISEDLEIGSMYWKGVLIHEFAHITETRAGRHQVRLCRAVTEYNALLVMQAWFRSQGTTYADVIGWIVPPFEAASPEEVRVCGLPRIYIEKEKRDDHETGDNPAG